MRSLFAVVEEMTDACNRALHIVERLGWACTCDLTESCDESSLLEGLQGRLKVSCRPDQSQINQTIVEPSEPVLSL